MSRPSPDPDPRNRCSPFGGLTAFAAAVPKTPPDSRFSQPAAPLRSFFDKGAGGAGFVRFRTTSQNFYDYDTKALAVGESNQGIVVRRRPSRTAWSSRRPRPIRCSATR